MKILVDERSEVSVKIRWMETHNVGEKNERERGEEKNESEQNDLVISAAATQNLGPRPHIFPTFLRFLLKHVLQFDFGAESLWNVPENFPQSNS